MVTLKSPTDVTCIVSDGFLSWTLASANKFGIPRISFFPISGYVSAVTQQVAINRLLSGPEAEDDLITVTRFPWIQVTRNEFFEPFNQRNPTGPQHDFFMECMITMEDSYGQVMNSFYQLEPLFLDYLNRDSKRKVWCVEPFCLGETESPPTVDPSAHQDSKPKWAVWLDQKQAQGCSVLYIAFGSQGEISPKQLEAISKGLEESQVNFLWVVRNCETIVVDEIQEKVAERRLTVRDWVDQWEILKHDSVKGFVSHCGWNSVLESISAEVPILAWPMMAEQPLMVVEEIKIGLRVETCDGSVTGFVKSEGLKKMVKELMEGEKGKQVRKKLKEVAKASKDAMAEDGSSRRTLDKLLDEVRAFRNIDTETYIPTILKKYVHGQKLSPIYMC